MTYKTLLAHLETDRPNDSVLAVTADLADRQAADVIGVAARQPVQIAYGAGYVAGAIFDLDRDEIDDELRSLETTFRRALPRARGSLEWRSARTIQSLAEYISAESQSADLIITAPDRGKGLVETSGRTSVGELVMRAGRPVLVVPDGLTGLDLNSVVIGWKNTREARRAVSDALPLLGQAARVTVVEIVPEDELAMARRGLDRVLAWLARHGIEADAQAIAKGAGDARRLEAVAQDLSAGLLVCGAYGHNRLREWIFGGVTCDLLMHPGICALISH